MPQETFTKAQFWSELDALGEDTVLVAHRVEHRWGKPPNAKAELAELWLTSKQDARALEASNKRDAREERTLAIAAEALSTAKDANRIASEDLAAAKSSASSALEQARWAKWAAIVAVIATVIATKDQILAFIFGLQ